MEITGHAMRKMIERKITKHDVRTAIMTGEIIENYPDDYPFPSCLMLGSNGLHVVAAIGEGRLFIITSYWPDVDKWEADLKTRKKGTE